MYKVPYIEAMESFGDILDMSIDVVQVAAMVVAIWTWNRYKHTTERYFLYYLIYVVANENLAYVYQWYTSNNNFFFYNIFMVVSFLFFIYWFGQILKRKTEMYVGIAIFLLSVIIPFTIEAFFSYQWVIPMYTGCVLIIAFTGLYFYSLLNENITTSLYSRPRFWIVIGLFIFHLGYLPIALFLEKNLDYNSLQYIMSLTLVNVIYYGCFIPSFLCRPKN